MTATAAQDLARRHVRFARWVVKKRVLRYIARKDRPRPRDVPDLIGAALDGLMRAAHDYTPDKQERFAFTSFAYRTVWAAAYRQYLHQVWPCAGWSSQREPPEIESLSSPRRRGERRVVAAPPADGLKWSEAEWNEVLRGMDARYGRVIRKRLREYMTLDQVARTESLTRERVRQIEAKAFMKLRDRAGKGMIRVDGFDDPCTGEWA